MGFVCLFACLSVCLYCFVSFWFGFGHFLFVLFLFILFLSLSICCLCHNNRLVYLRDGSAETDITCCHTETRAADQTCRLTRSQGTDGRPTSPSTDPVPPGRVATAAPTVNNNNNRIQRRYSRFLTISSQRRELSPTRTIKWPGRNRVPITCNTWSVDHVQVSCYVPLGTKGQLSY